MFCLFDDVNFAKAKPVTGRQPDPKPGVHNSRWVPSPSPEKVTDKNGLFVSFAGLRAHQEPLKTAEARRNQRSQRGYGRELA